MPDFPKKLNKKQKEAYLQALPFHILLPRVIEDYRLFSKYLNSYIQDSYCEDCLNTTDECECDYCDYCKLQRCMCDINSYNELIDWIVKYLFNNFSKKQIDMFIKNINDACDLYERTWIDYSQIIYDARSYIFYTMSSHVNKNPKKLTKINKRTISRRK